MAYLAILVFSALIFCWHWYFGGARLFSFIRRKVTDR